MIPSHFQSHLLENLTYVINVQQWPQNGSPESATQMHRLS